MKYAMHQIKKETHELLKNYSQEHGFKMGSLVENLIKKHMIDQKYNVGIRYKNQP
jgi:hypothetical protein